MESGLLRQVALALSRRRRFALTEARVDRLCRSLAPLAEAPVGTRLTCWLDRPDGSLVAAAMARPWACLELSCSASLDDLFTWEVGACRTRGPSLTQARFTTPASLLPALLRGRVLPAGGDGSPGATRQLAVFRMFRSLRGDGPLFPALAIRSQRLAVRVGDAMVILEWGRSVHVAQPGLLDDVASGRPPELGEAHPLGGGVLEVQGATSLPPSVARALEGIEPSGGSAFASACAVAFPGGLAGATQ